MAASQQSAPAPMQPGKVGGRRFHSPSNTKGAGFVCGRANCNSLTSFACFALRTSAVLAPGGIPWNLGGSLDIYQAGIGRRLTMATAVASAQVFAVKLCSVSRSHRAQVDLNSLPISRRLAVAVASSSSLSLISLPPVAVARERRNRKAIPLEDFRTSPDGLKYYDVVEGKGPVADEGTTVEVHFDCVYRGITAVSSRESKLLAGNRIIAQRYVFKVGSPPGKERKRDYVDSPNGLFSAQAAPKPPPAMYKMARGMRVGGKRIVVVPPEAGYGDRGMNEIPPGATFDLNIELLKVIAANGK